MPRFKCIVTTITYCILCGAIRVALARLLVVKYGDVVLWLPRDPWLRTSETRESKGEREKEGKKRVPSRDASNFTVEFWTRRVRMLTLIDRTRYLL